MSLEMPLEGRLTTGVPEDGSASSRLNRAGTEKPPPVEDKDWWRLRLRLQV
jgi:hypothetical protein